MPKKRTMGADPLEGMVTETPAQDKTEPMEEIRIKKAKFTFHLPVELGERAKDAAVHLAGPPEYLTLAGLVTQALEERLDQLEKKHNKGKPFPKRPHRLKGGRPIGS